MNKIKCYLLTVFAVVLALVTVGCKPYADDYEILARQNRLKIGVCFYRYDDVFASYLRQEIQSAAKSKNVELFMNDAKNDQEIQNEQIDALIEKGVDVIVISIVEMDATSTIIDKVKEAGIPIVFFNIPPHIDVVSTYDQARFVGTVPEEAGIIQGEVILNIWNSENWDKNGDGIMQYVMIKGVYNNLEAIARTEYSIDTVVKGGVNVEELGEAVADWNFDQGKAAMAEFFEEYGDKIEFVVSNNDSMAAGAIEVLNNAGYNKGDGGKYIPVVGVDATEQAKDLINKGRMSGTVKQDAVAMGNAVVTLATNAASGNDFLAGTNYKYDDTGIAIRIPYQPFTGN